MTNELQITRTINGQTCSFPLTETELEDAYRLKERRYREDDFVNAFADASQDPDMRFHYGHLAEFPELLDWLCRLYDDIFDANMSHNDLMELALNRLQDESLTPGSFTSLALLAPAVCEGLKKNPAECEEECGRYYRCMNITEADERSKCWEMLSSLLTMHQDAACTCHGKAGHKSDCPAAKYLKGIWDISDFFHLQDKKEAV